MTPSRIRLIAVLMTGVVVGTTFVEDATACFLRRRRCRVRCCVPVRCCQPVACQPSPTNPSVPDGTGSPDGTGRHPKDDPKQLPEISAVPAETPALVVPDAVKAIEGNTTTEGGREATIAAVSEIRTWTSSDGRVCRARLVSFAGDTVVLEKEGRTYNVPLDRLSEDYVTLVRSAHAPVVAAVR